MAAESCTECSVPKVDVWVCRVENWGAIFSHLPGFAFKDPCQLNVNLDGLEFFHSCGPQRACVTSIKLNRADRYAA